MTTVIEVQNLTRRYRDTLALDDVSLTFEQDVIYGLLGRNGAGKTTLMSILTAQNFASSGTVRVFGADPYENDAVLRRLCFVRESQKYPDDAKPKHAFAAAALSFPHWDAAFAAELVAAFEVPVNRTIKKLSRGQTSAVGAIIGLASRAEVTFFDEPYLGLDAVARQIFYDRLIADYAEHPRTIVLSSHLIDEISSLVERVVLLDRGRVLLDEDTDSLRGQASTIVGRAAAVDEFARDREVIHRTMLGGIASVTVLGRLDDDDRRRLTDLALETAPVSLQQLVVRLSDGALDHPTQEGARR